MKKLLLSAFAWLPAMAVAEPLDYDYVYLSAMDTESDSADDSGETVGGFWSFAKTLHLFASYDDAGAYAGGGNPDWDFETRTLRFGVGGHYLVGKRSMIAPGIALLRAEQRVNAPGWAAPREFSDTGYAVQLDFRHAFSNWFEATAGARHTRLFDDGATEFVGGALVHPTDWIALGALYHDGDDRRGIEFTVRWYY